MTKKIRITLVLVFLTANSSSALFAAEAARQYAVDYLNDERALSPNESQLADYLSERAVIFQRISASKSPYVLRQKLKILNKKITYLENEITRNRRRAPSTENPRPVTPVSRPPKPAVVAEVKPPIESKIQPVVVSSPVSEAKVLSVQNAPPAPPIATQMPKTVEFKKEEPIILVRPQMPPSPLVAPIAMPPPIVPPVETPKPVAAAKVQEPPAETPKPVLVTKVQEPTAKMGADWVAMSPEEKEMYVFSATGALVRRDVFVMKSSYFYIQALDQTLEKNPSLKDQYLDDLFISSIYENEPHTRTAIDKIKIRR